MKVLRFFGFVVCCAGGLGCGDGVQVVHTAESRGTPPLAPNPEGRILTGDQLEAIVKPSLEDCAPGGRTLKKSGRIDPASVIPSRNAKQFPGERIAKTLHGMWRGRVVGDDKDVSVDYFWIFDMKGNEALIIAQRTGKETMANLQPLANAPKLTYLMCAHEGYVPSKDAPQMQEFVKVSNDLKDAPRVLQEATGLKTQELKTREALPTPSEMWNGLLETKYFSRAPAVAFAGGFFKPIQIAPVETPIGPSQISMKWDATYYGGGSTAIKFTDGVAMKGVEYAQFVGTTAPSGDFLVSSPGNGRLWKVEAVAGGVYDLGFDSVVLGPLQE